MPTTAIQHLPSARLRAARFFSLAAQGALCAAVVFAPWAYGSIRPWAIRDLTLLLAAASFCWLTDCALRRRWPHVPRAAVVVSLALVLEGWAMTLNAYSTFDPALRALLPLASPFPHLPGSADAAASWSEIFFLTTLLGAFLLTCDLARDAKTRRNLVAPIALTGASIAAFGLVQKLGGDAVLAWTWEPDKRDVTSNFALFRYRGNAGAFLNLILPLVAALVFIAFQRRDRPWSRALWCGGLFLLVMGLAVNPSRACWGIALLLGLACITAFLESGKSASLKQKWLSMVVAAILSLLIIGSITHLGGWQTGWDRMSLLGLDAATRSPLEIYARMLPDAGWFGFGPASFRSVFATYQQTYDFGDRAAPMFWKTGQFGHAHEDYFEVVIDWGFLGALGWSFLVFGGIARGITRLRFGGTRDPLLAGCLLAWLGLLLLALVDFPLQIDSIRLYAVVLLALCWSPPTNRQPRRANQSTASSAQLFAADTGGMP